MNIRWLSTLNIVGLDTQVTDKFCIHGSIEDGATDKLTSARGFPTLVDTGELF